MAEDNKAITLDIPGQNPPLIPPPEPEASFSECFRFATRRDYLILFSGLILAFINGASLSFFGLVIGLAVNSFDVRYSELEIRERAKNVFIYFILLGVTIFIGTFGSRTLLRTNAKRQGVNIRRAYYKALLQKDPSYYDTVNPMEISSQVESDCKAIVETLDVKLESIVFTLGAITSGLIISFCRSWEITLMVFIAIPFIVGSMGLFILFIVKAAMQRANAYEKAGGIAEEALTNIRTVVSLGGEKTEVKRYDNAVRELQEMLSRTGIYQGMANGFREMVFYVIVAVVFYIGSEYIQNGRINPTTGNPYIAADVFTPISAIFVSFSQLPLVAGSIKAISIAKIKIKKILDTVDSTVAIIGPLKTVRNFQGSITFKKVSFAYPGMPDNTVLKDLSVHIEPNTKVAFVGESGSGKSTIIQLLQKFYEPRTGSIEFDGHNINALNPVWLKRNLAYVGQEPVLFSMSIRENLLLAKPEASEQELIQALKRANAYSFVMEMEKKMDTHIGGGIGVQLSGGQKQRIAIARAILKDSRILLLDEATSALDRLSEKEIQETLDGISGDRTIIIVAHRLSTIQGADQIIVLDKGKVEEIGTHMELMNKNGKYYKLQTAQATHEEQKEQEEREAALNKTQSPGRSSLWKTVELDEEEEEDKQEEIDDSQSANESSRLIKRRFSLQSNRSAMLEEEKAPQGKKGGPSFADIKKIWGYAKLERKYFFLGLLGSIGTAIVIPSSHIIMSGALDTFVYHDDPEFRPMINMYCILELVAGCFIFVLYTIEIGYFAKASETFIQNLRVEIFYKFLRMHIGWHDEPQNSPANLATSLEVDTGNVGQLTGTSLGLIIQIILTNITALIIAFCASWQLALIGMWIVPLVLFVAVKLFSNETKGSATGQAHIRKAEVLVSESLNNMKTVISLNAENKFLKEYSNAVEDYENTMFKVRMMNGLYEGGMNLILFTDLAGMYYLGSNLFFSLDLSPMRIFLAVFGLALTAFFSTQLFFLIPDTGRALLSVKTILAHLSRRSKIDIEDKKSVYRGKIQGNIEFRNVRFAYPTRPAKILNELSFKISAGKQIGITGPSGCGKSTIMQLLLRFYDVDAGEILIEGINIKEYDLKYLRQKIGVVFQEPVLFNESIEYNLKYANYDVTDDEMTDAARKANALRFIEANGFQRVVGSKGGQLSGGQKQRIAIARAILRKPKILLLDEATSALDTQSEAMVQDALSKASQGLTTVSIAHRFTTLRGVEEAIVMKDGQVVERGKYDELLEKKGLFYELTEGAK